MTEAGTATHRHSFQVPTHDDAPDHEDEAMNGGVDRRGSGSGGGAGPLFNPLMMEPAHADNDDNDNTEFKDDGHGGGAPGSASNPQVVINIIISFVGAGLLGVPNAFSKAGWFLGSVTLITISILNVYAMMLLPQVKRRLVAEHKQDVHSYGDLGRILLGSRGEVLVNICLGVSQAGFATAYIIFIAANLYSMARVPRFLVCLLCIPGLGFLVSLREMKQLAPFSLLANGANFCALTAVLVQDFKSLKRQSDGGDDEDDDNTAGYHNATFDPFAGVANDTAVDDKSIFQQEADELEEETMDETIYAIQWSGFLYVIAITIYSMEGVGLILSLESSARNPHMFAPLLKGTVGCITAFMAFFGTAGYLAFGPYTMAPITLNLAGSFVAVFVKLSLCLGLYLTYPIMMFPIWSISERLYPKLKEHPRSATNFRVAVVCCSALVAYAVPDFGKFLSLVGSSICTLLGFILPCYFHWKAFGEGKELPPWQNRLNLGLMIGGTFFGILGTFQSFVAMLHGELEGDVRRLQEHHLHDDHEF